LAAFFSPRARARATLPCRATGAPAAGCRPFRFLAVGKLERRKNYAALLDLLQAIRTATWVVPANISV
jgi:hypothetical protein